MTEKERDKAMMKLLERTAWLQGRLEDIHLQTSEIPRLREHAKEVRTNIKLLWGSIVVGALVSAPAVYAHAMEVLGR
jgi:hypothetical protein